MTAQTNPKTLQFKDPYPDVHGVLLSDYIRQYVELFNMIEPFDDKNLQAASYELHVGDRFYMNNKRITPNDNGEVEIPKNGLMYFSMKETLNLPPFIVAIHDLRVKQVYRGLLVGRSVHVAPGYSGRINYPIFNFTSQARTLRIGEPIGTIIFLKTTPFGSPETWKVREAVSRSSEVKGVAGLPCKQTPVMADRDIPSYWGPGETHTSAVFELQSEFEKVDSSVKTRFRIGYIAAFALIVAVAGHIFQQIRWVSDKHEKVSERISAIEANSQIHASEQVGRRELEEMAKKLAIIEDRIDRSLPSSRDGDGLNQKPK